MSLLSNLRAERLIAEIKAAGDTPESDTRKALDKLAKLGPAAIPRIIDALANADKQETAGFVSALSSMLDARTFPVVAEGLKDGNQRTVAAVVWAMSSAKNYPASMLYNLLEQPDMPKGQVVSILAAQKARLNARELLKHAYAQEPTEKAALFRVIGEIADPAIVPELISRLGGKDPIARVHIINILSRFNRPEVGAALQTQLKDTSKFIRQAVLNALARLDGNVDIALLCEVLRDHDVETQQKAIDAVVRANHPETIKHLVSVLRDEDEGARRAAVEVLNEIGTPQHVKYLLQSIKDDDWWVRSRAADALAKIGGPRVIDAALELIRDQDEDVRRAAIEILNQTKDERAVNFLIDATHDKDWWVRERAVDALAEIGSSRALPSLVELLRAGDERSLPTVVRAIGKIGGSAQVPHILPHLENPSKEIRLEAITALTRLVNEQSAEGVRARLEVIGAVSADHTVSHAALRAVEDLDSRFSSGAVAVAAGAARMAEPARTLLVDRPESRGSSSRSPSRSGSTSRN